jgi:hypothetical protein
MCVPYTLWVADKLLLYYALIEITLIEMALSSYALINACMVQSSIHIYMRTQIKFLWITLRLF